MVIEGGRKMGEKMREKKGGGCMGGKEREVEGGRDKQWIIASGLYRETIVSEAHGIKHG